MASPPLRDSRFGGLSSRILTTLVSLPLFLVVLWLGGLWWVAGVAAVAGIGAVEFTRLYVPPAPGPRVGLIAGVAGIAALIVWGPISVVLWVVALAGVIVLVGAIFPFLVGGGASALSWIRRAWPAVPLGVAYLGGPAGVLVRWRDGNFAPVAAFLAMIWANDVAAYFVGSYFGRHKMAVRISPGKSWEGAMAGVLVAGTIGAWSASLFGLSGPWGAALGAFIGAVAQAGDLFESALKRTAGVKDSGAILPGHGGVLDRFDGVLFAAPVGFLILHPWAP